MKSGKSFCARSKEGLFASRVVIFANSHFNETVGIEAAPARGRSVMAQQWLNRRRTAF